MTIVTGKVKAVTKSCMLDPGGNGLMRRGYKIGDSETWYNSFDKTDHQLFKYGDEVQIEINERNHIISFTILKAAEPRPSNNGGFKGKPKSNFGPNTSTLSKDLISLAIIKVAHKVTEEQLQASLKSVLKAYKAVKKVLDEESKPVPPVVTVQAAPAATAVAVPAVDTTQNISSVPINSAPSLVPTSAEAVSEDFDDDLPFNL